MSNADIVERLRGPVPSILAMREAANEIEALRRTRDRLRATIKEMEREHREDTRSAAAEASWRERQGEEYGSY